MSHNNFRNTDKIELHYRQQLSALVDGELSADESRFLLRRLQHDAELMGCQERWQLCGDVLRGAAGATAPLDFAARVQTAIANESAPVANAAASAGGARWRWGGGAALAASVAALALFMARERLPETAQESVTEPVTVVAATAQLPVTSQVGAVSTSADTAPVVVAAAPAAAIAAAARRSETSTRRVAAATRSQQAARSAASRQTHVPQRQVAATPVQQPLVAAAVTPLAPSVQANPFAHPATLQVKPWPRSSIGSSSSPISASLSASGEQRPATFYPFEPRQLVPPVKPEPELRLPQQ